MIRIVLRHSPEVEIKDADTAIYAGKTQPVAHSEVVARVLEVSKGNEVIASFNAEDVIYFIEEKEENEEDGHLIQA